MKLEVHVESYDTRGGAAATTLAAAYLDSCLRELPPESLQVVVTACFHSKSRPHRTLESLWREFHDSLSGLPRARYSARRRRLDVRYASALPAEHAIEAAESDLEVFQAIVQELSVVLSEAISEHKSLRNEVPLDELEAALVRAAVELPTTPLELDVFITTENGHAIAEAALRSPWEKLGIEWSRYHACARELLDDPFYWDPSDEYAPHGNDTGADLLEAFREWRRRHRHVPAARFLPTMLKRWNYTGSVASLLGKPMSQWDDDDELTLEVLDEANVAVAFAQLKLEGKCDEDVRLAALQSIERQLDPAVHDHFGWTLPEEQRERLEQMRSKLRG
jgi:uncharacterized protein YfeS